MINGATCYDVMKLHSGRNAFMLHICNEMLAVMAFSPFSGSFIWFSSHSQSLPHLWDERGSWAAGAFVYLLIHRPMQIEGERPHRLHGKLFLPLNPPGSAPQDHLAFVYASQRLNICKQMMMMMMISLTVWTHLMWEWFCQWRTYLSVILTMSAWQTQPVEFIIVV